MNDDEYVLSDVHTFVPLCRKDAKKLDKYTVVSSRFQFRMIKSNSEVEQTSAAILDKDGDYIVSRSSADICDVIFIDHALETQLVDVGLQVWNGCLYLCDYILHCHTQFSGATVVELGSGVGLASIVAAMFTRTVYCTDIGDDILALCKLNTERNRAVYEQEGKDSESLIKIRQLDWTRPLDDQDLSSRHSLSRDDIRAIRGASIIMAADVVYSDDLTEGFFSTICDIMTPSAQNKYLYISVEKRLNFTLDDLDVTCPAYNRFRSKLDELNVAAATTDRHFRAELIPDFPQYFSYQRTKYLELWKISSWS